MLQALSAILILVSTFWTNVLQKFERVPPPCTTPIAYTVGSFDRDFNISQKDFLSALSEAEQIWERPLRGEGSSAGRDLFAYSPEKGKLDINLVYDYRQQVTEELGQIKGVVKEGESEYGAMEIKYLALKKEYEGLKESYDSRVKFFDIRNSAYEQALEKWNKGSRNDESEFRHLESERLALEAEIGALKPLESHLNSMVPEINALVRELNQLARTLNLNVKQYNTIGASRGDTFAGGLYTKDAGGERIDIFEFSSHDKLVRVLAHELGHALGLDHVDDPQAIMYKLNEGEVEKLTETDLSALKTLCKIN